MSDYSDINPDGFSKRELIAMHLMAGLLQSSRAPYANSSEEHAILAVTLADCLINELNKERK